MFRRLLLEDTAALFTIVAFVTAFSIYVAFTWRAIRMKRPQVERFENLPFDTPTPAIVGAQSCCALREKTSEGRSETAPLQS
jgi:hypothetical protein